MSSKSSISKPICIRIPNHLLAKLPSPGYGVRNKTIVAILKAHYGVK